MKYILITLILSISLVSCNNEENSGNKINPIVEKTKIKEKVTNEKSTDSTENEISTNEEKKVSDEESTGSTKNNDNIAKELEKEIQSIEPVNEYTKENVDTGSTQELETEVNDLLNEFIDSLDTYE